MNGIYVRAISDQLPSISSLYHYDVAELGKRHTATNHTVRILETDMGHAMRNLTAGQTEDCVPGAVEQLQKQVLLHHTVTIHVQIQVMMGFQAYVST